MWGSWEPQTREALQCYKQSLLGLSVWCLEWHKNGQNDMAMVTVESAHVVSEGSEESVRNWAIGHSCDIVAHNLAPLCPCPQNLIDVELRNMDLFV